MLIVVAVGCFVVLVLQVSVVVFSVAVLGVQCEVPTSVFCGGCVCLGWCLHCQK